MATVTESDVRNGHLASEFFFVYQPIFELSTGQVPRVEALVRWQHPVFGELRPGAFLPLLKSADLATWFTEWSLRSAIADLPKLRSYYGPHVQVSVNLSQSQLAEADQTSELVAAVLSSYGEDARSLCIEIIEDLSGADIRRSADALARLRAMGIKVVLDDFGTGASALSALIDAGYDGLKIDRRFTREIVTGSTARSVVEALVSISEEVDISIVAEGIETIIELRDLSAMGCKLGQGYLLARPAPLSAGPQHMGHPPIARPASPPLTSTSTVEFVTAQLQEVNSQPTASESFEEQHRQLIHLDDLAKSLGPAGNELRCEIGCRMTRLALYWDNWKVLAQWAFHTSRFAARIGEWGYAGEAMALMATARATDPEYASLRLEALARALDIRATRPLDSDHASGIDNNIGNVFENLGLYRHAHSWYGQCFARRSDEMTRGAALCALNLGDLELDRLDDQAFHSTPLKAIEHPVNMDEVVGYLAANPFAYAGVEATLRCRLLLIRGNVEEADRALNECSRTDHLGQMVFFLYAQAKLEHAKGNADTFLAATTELVEVLKDRAFLRHQLRARHLHAKALAAVGRDQQACEQLEQLVRYQADQTLVDLSTLFSYTTSAMLNGPLAGAGIGRLSLWAAFANDA